MLLVLYCAECSASQTESAPIVGTQGRALYSIPFHCGYVAFALRTPCCMVKAAPVQATAAAQPRLASVSKTCSFSRSSCCCVCASRCALGPGHSWSASCARAHTRSRHAGASSRTWLLPCRRRCCCCWCCCTSANPSGGGTGRGSCQPLASLHMRGSRFLAPRAPGRPRSLAPRAPGRARFLATCRVGYATLAGPGPRGQLVLASGAATMASWNWAPASAACCSDQTSQLHCIFVAWHRVAFCSRAFMRNTFAHPNSLQRSGCNACR